MWDSVKNKQVDLLHLYVITQKPHGAKKNMVHLERKADDGAVLENAHKCMHI